MMAGSKKTTNMNCNKVLQYGLGVFLQCFFILMSLALTIADACEYRSIDPKHTMCTFAPKQCSGKPIIRSGGLSCKDKEAILTAHNRLRQEVALGRVKGQPPAINMRAMVWDEELANVAQRWADQCMPGHDRSRNVGRFQAGQNVAAVWTYERDLGDAPDFETQVEAWFDEVNKFGFSKSSISPFRFFKPSGHYTQLAWAETYLVGCGYSYYKDPMHGYTKLYVCNYGPGGNVIGGTFYKIAFPGQQYCVNDGLKSSTIYRGLCEESDVSYESHCNIMKPLPPPMFPHPMTNTLQNFNSPPLLPPPMMMVMMPATTEEPSTSASDMTLKNPFMALFKTINQRKMMTRFNG